MNAGVALLAAEGYLQGAVSLCEATPVGPVRNDSEF